jgi:AcrR family transcriptional regulator
MPAPSRTSPAAIIGAARDILEAEGLEAVSMQAVAERVGVRAPSLYKHVADRTALVRAVVDAVVADLAAALAPRRPSRDPRDDLRGITRRYRAFVHANPVGYGLLFARLGPGLQPDEAVLAALGVPIVEATARLVGEERALEAARTIVAWAHGFASLELAGGFRMGGDIDAAYERGIDLILAGISASASRAAG